MRRHLRKKASTTQARGSITRPPAKQNNPINSFAREERFKVRGLKFQQWLLTRPEAKAFASVKSVEALFPAPSTGEMEVTQNLYSIPFYLNKCLGGGGRRGRRRADGRRQFPAF